MVSLHVFLLFKLIYFKVGSKFFTELEKVLLFSIGKKINLTLPWHWLSAKVRSLQGWFCSLTFSNPRRFWMLVLNLLKLSLVERHLVKMNIIPRFSYWYQFFFLRPFYKQVDSLVSEFIWSKKDARLYKQYSLRPRKLWGLAIPTSAGYGDQLCPAGIIEGPCSFSNPVFSFTLNQECACQKFS